MVGNIMALQVRVEKQKHSGKVRNGRGRSKNTMLLCGKSQRHTCLEYLEKTHFLSLLTLQNIGYCFHKPGSFYRRNLTAHGNWLGLKVIAGLWSCFFSWNVYVTLGIQDQRHRTQEATEDIMGTGNSNHVSITSRAEY